MVESPGSALWTFEASDERVSGLEVAGDLVFVGAGSTVAGLDAATGAPRWRSRVTLDSPSWLSNEPRLSVGAGAVYVATGSSVVALDAATGRRRWSTHLGPMPRYEAMAGVTVAAVDGLVLATAANRLVALDSATGRPSWTHEVVGRFAGSPCSEGGRVFVASGADIEAVDLATGTLLWRYGTGGDTAGELAVSEGVVVRVGARSDVVAVDAVSGVARWTASVGEGQAGRPGVANGVVLVLGRDERIHALDLATGTERWAGPRPVAGHDPVDVGPAVDGGVVYAANAMGLLYAIDVATGAIRWRYRGEGIGAIAAGAGTVCLADLPFVSGRVQGVRPGSPRFPRLITASRELRAYDFQHFDGEYFSHVYQYLSCSEGLDVRGFLDEETETAAARLAELAPLRHRERISEGHDPVDDERLRCGWKMYALSRISDYLLELSCPEGSVPSGFGVSGGRRFDPRACAAYTDFFTGIGLTPFEHGESFSPFHHEIFAVVPDDDAPTVTVAEVLWPGYWFGDLLFSRAGVRVRAPRHLIDPVTATTSTLYFTYRRQPRRTNDLSHGWGSNSQWATKFPRFYSDAEGLHLNWDGKTDIGADVPTSPPGRRDTNAERPLRLRRELLLHRCFVGAPAPDDNGWSPFGTRMSISASTWPLPDDAIVHPAWSE